MRYVVEGDHPYSGAAFQILTVIAYRADRDSGVCFVSRRRLARESRVSTSTVHEVLTRLLDDGALAVVCSGSGRKSTAYQIIGHLDPSGSLTDSPSAVAPVDNLSSGSPIESEGGSLTESQDSVVARSPDASGSPRQAVVARSPDSHIRKEGKDLEGFEGGVAPTDSTPDGVGRSSNEPDPVALMDEAVLSFDPSALRDPDGWNLSERFGRAWLPNEDVARWLRQQRATRQGATG